MKIANLGNVRKLPDTHDSGFGYDFCSGDSLYIVALVDCHQPPSYFLRCDLDDWEALTEMAEECLCETVDDDDIARTVAEEGKPIEALLEEGIAFRMTASGRIIWADSASLINYQLHKTTSANF